MKTIAILILTFVLCFFPAILVFVLQSGAAALMVSVPASFLTITLTISNFDVILNYFE